MGRDDTRTTTEERIDLFQPQDQTLSPCLIVISSPASHAIGRTFRLDQHELIMGRGIRSDVPIDDAGVSRDHAKVVTVQGVCTLVDMGSTNGSFVNGERVQERVLVEGDKIQIGRLTVLKFTLQDPLEELAHRKLYNQAVKDGLTGLHNRRYFTERFATEFAHAHRHHRPMSLLLFDLDKFKLVNDTWGHAAGDAVLKAVSKAVYATVRTGDIVARIGGEEFAVLLRDATLDDARRYAERLREAVSRLSVPWEKEVITVTISIGVAGFDGQEPEAHGELLQRADEFLYAAKRGGRNRVEG